MKAYFKYYTYGAYNLHIYTTGVLIQLDFHFFRRQFYQM